MIKKIIAVCIFALIAASYLDYDRFQFKHAEAASAYSSLKRIKTSVGSDDLVFVQKFDEKYYEIITPIKYFFNLKTFAVDNISVVQSLLTRNQYLVDHYQNFFLFADRPLLNQPDWIKFVSNIPYQEGDYQKNGQFPPNNYSYYKHNFYLYRVDLAQINHILFQKSGNFVLRRHPESLINFNKDNAWSKDCSKIIALNYSLNNKTATMQINLLSGRVNWQNPKTFNLRVLANNVPLSAPKIGHTFYQFFLPASLKTVKDLTICVDTFNPKALGNSKDDRDLGLNIGSIQIKPVNEPAVASR